MKITKTHEIDCSEKGEDGFYDWFYEFDLYHFSFSNVTLSARSYSDTPKEVCFFTYEKDGKEANFDNNCLESAEFLEAIQYLVAIGKYNKFNYFNGSYQDIPLWLLVRVENT